jgi:hypothetical protein
MPSVRELYHRVTNAELVELVALYVLEAEDMRRIETEARLRSAH